MIKKRNPYKDKLMQKMHRHELLRSQTEASPGPFDIILVLDSLKATFNVGKIFRVAEAFGVHAIYLVNIHFFNPLPAKGCVRKVYSQSFETFDDCYKRLKTAGYTIYGLDVDANDYINRISLPKKTAFVLGHEKDGLSFSTEKYNDIKFVKIPMYGKVESLNVSIAASLATYQYIGQYGTK